MGKDKDGVDYRRWKSIFTGKSTYQYISNLRNNSFQWENPSDLFLYLSQNRNRYVTDMLWNKFYTWHCNKFQSLFLNENIWYLMYIPLNIASEKLKQSPRCALFVIEGHYNDIIMNAMASQITSLTIVYSTIYSRHRSKKTSKLCVTGLCEGNSPVTSEFPAQRASNAENVSIWWRHHGFWNNLLFAWHLPLPNKPTLILKRILPSS